MELDWTPNSKQGNGTNKEMAHNKEMAPASSSKGLCLQKPSATAFEGPTL